MNELVKLPQLNKVMQTMSAELMKAGIIEEMISDSMDSMDEEGLEEARVLEASVSHSPQFLRSSLVCTHFLKEAEAEVEKVLTEITTGIPAAPRVSLPTKDEDIEDEKEDVEADKDIQARLSSLKAQ